MTHEFQDNIAGARVETAHWEKISPQRLDYTSALEQARVMKLDIQDPEGPSIGLGETINLGKAGPVDKIPLFTFTSKMSCASFSLAAGPKTQGGTCITSNYGKQEFVSRARDVEQEDPENFTDSGTLEKIGKRGPKDRHYITPKEIVGTYICDLCYAGKGSYSMFKRVQLYQIARKIWVDAALKAGTFVDEVSDGIRTLLSNERLMKGNLSSSHHFRIHDSGDFFSPEYMEKWFDVCLEFADEPVDFWCPTRVWAIEAFRKVMVGNVPENLSLRPSALIYGSMAPVIEGVSGGSTSAPYPLAGAKRSHWDCPAYQSLSGSCAESGCRVCWERPDYPVNYLTH